MPKEEIFELIWTIALCIAPAYGIVFARHSKTVIREFFGRFLMIFGMAALVDHFVH